MKKTYFYVGVFALLIGVLFIIESNIPKPINWDPTFDETHKMPWGTYVLHNELDNFFPNSTTEDIKETPYETLYYNGICYNTSYLFIEENFDPDLESIEEMLGFVEDGNTVFISASSMSRHLLDTLKVTLEHQFIYDLENDTLKKPLYFSNEKLNDIYYYDRGFTRSSFTGFDTETTQTLGFHSFDSLEYVNYINVEYGKGNFYLHTQPFVFTNYHLLREDHANYVSDVFSYLDNDNIYWDSKNKDGIDEHTSILRYILTNPSLRFAWRLGLVGILLFVLFMTKRRQRIVPVIKKLPNTSIEFAKTIGNLYFQEGETSDIVAKKITFFLQKIRSNYLIDTHVLDENFRKRLHQKSGVSQEEIDKLINYIIFLSKKQIIDETFLITLNRLIENFDKKTL